MKFYTKNVRLVSIRQFTSKNGNLLTFLKVTDKETYDSAEFMAAKDFDAMSVHEGSDYNLVVDYDGRYMNALLEPLSDAGRK